MTVVLAIISGEVVNTRGGLVISAVSVTMAVTVVKVLPPYEKEIGDSDLDKN